MGRQWAEAQDGRHEFDGLQPVPMGGGTNNHGRIACNLLVALHLGLRGSPCEAFGSDAGGVATTANKVRHPEATVTCSEAPGTTRLIPDPVVAFEVMSPSPAGIGRGVKLREYQAIPSIRRYVLIEQDSIAFTVHARHDAEP